MRRRLAGTRARRTRLRGKGVLLSAGQPGAASFRSAGYLAAWEISSRSRRGQVCTGLPKPGPARNVEDIGRWRLGPVGRRRIPAASRGVRSGLGTRWRTLSFGVEAVRISRPLEEPLVSASARPASTGGCVRMGLTSGGRSEHPDPARDDSFDGFSSFGVLGKRGVFDALFKFVTFGCCAFLDGNGFVDVGGHREEMRSGQFVTRLFLVERDASGVRLQRFLCGFRREL